MTVSAPPGKEAAPLRILLITESREEARQIEEALAAPPSRRYELRHADRLAAGLAMIEAKGADVILLDPELPDSRGVETVRKVTQHSPVVPVIVCTSDVHEDTAVLSVRMGAEDYLFKPKLGPQALWRAMNHAVERKRLQEALRKSQERFELITRGSTDGLWDWSIDTREVYYSPQWKGLVGCEEDEVGTDFKEWEKRIHPEDLQRALAAVSAYLRGESPQLWLEHRMRHKDGTYRWVLARGVALRYSDGRPYRMAGTHVDITDLKSSQQRLEEAHRRLTLEHEKLKATQNQLIQAEKMNSIGRMAAGIAHELKNPLATVSMGVEFLTGALAQPDESTKMVLQEMGEAVERADGIARGLLEYSAPVTIQTHAEDLNLLVKKALVLARHEIARARVQVEQDLAPDLPRMDLDRNKIIQVLLNLIINAIHAMGQDGTISIRTYVATVGELQQRRGPEDTELADMSGVHVLMFELDDTGPGIAPEHLKSLFDPFFTTKPTGKGTGLGLAVCKSIVELHGGSIDLANRDGGGARATIRFLP